jgi:2-phosphosulfolactate phosphatase
LILSTLADSPRQTSIIVVLDVFRASNTMIELLSRGAARVVPVLEEADARRLKAEHPDWLLLGERQGKRLPGFDGDNSPAGIAEVDGGVAGKTAILTTSGGTRILDACAPDAQVLIGSFANARAVIAALKKMGGAADPTFWAVGLAADTPADEDVLCAQYLAELFAGRIPDFAEVAQAARIGAGGDRLRRNGLDADLEFCLQLDTRALVPRRARGADGLWSVAAPDFP